MNKYDQQKEAVLKAHEILNRNEAFARENPEASFLASIGCELTLIRCLLEDKRDGNW